MVVHVTTPKMIAGIDLIGRTGADNMQLRWSDDEVPKVWIAVALYSGGRFVVAAGATAEHAVLQLCEQVVDGGTCTWCKRPTAMEPASLDDMPAPGLICWYQWDPELETYRRGCEGTVGADDHLASGCTHPDCQPAGGAAS